MGFFRKTDVTNDNTTAIAMKTIELLTSTESPDFPMLELMFSDTRILVLFVEGGHGAPVIYQRMRQAGGIDEDTCNKMIGRCIHADQLPSNFNIEFKYNGSGGECDSYIIKGEIPTEHRKAQKEYITEITKRCTEKGIKYKLIGTSMKFLKWA